MELPKVGQWIVHEDFQENLEVYEVDVLYLPKTAQYPHVTKQHYTANEVGIGLKESDFYTRMQHIRFVSDTEKQCKLFISHIGK